MATNKKIITSELDFDKIKASLKNYLQGQEEFTDYDFEGSGLTMLLDVLAYNTHYNALYTNLAINEAFLDSASKRASVVSKAKELGYTPLSAIAATATVNITFNAENAEIAPSTLELARYSPFSATANGITFVFYTTGSRLASKVNNLYTFTDVEIKEGSYLSYRYNVVGGDAFVLPNGKVDLSTLRVRVQDNAQSSVYTTFTRSDTLMNVTSDTNAYFVKEIDGGLYQLEFGNDIIGKALSPGNVVTVDYLSTSAELANGARGFTFAGSMLSGMTSATTTTFAAVGGSQAESIDSIKWNAPRQFATQNRCVTVDDYKTVIQANYPNVDSINVWGGEQNIPPSYGDVFISIKPAAGIFLSAAEQSVILNDIVGPRRVVTMHPKLVDPAYLNLAMEVSFYYNPTETALSSSDLTTIVRDTIIDYNNNSLQKFGGVFKYSQLTRLIDGTNPAIVNCIVTFKVRRPVPIVYNEVAQYSINVSNPIYNSGVPEESILSTGFSALNTEYTCYIEDVPTPGSNIGVLRMFYILNSRKNFVRNVGTVNYATGAINISDVIITSAEQDSLEFIIKTQSNDVVSKLNQIVQIREDLLNITPIINNSADNYQFATSRN